MLACCAGCKGHQCFQDNRTSVRANTGDAALFKKNSPLHIQHKPFCDYCLREGCIRDTFSNLCSYFKSKILLSSQMLTNRTNTWMVSGFSARIICVKQSSNHYSSTDAKVYWFTTKEMRCYLTLLYFVHTF